MTNGTAGNEIVAYRRSGTGVLTSIGSFSTGGTGTGGGVDPLGSEYALILSADNSMLFAVNAGSNDVSSFRVNSDASLTLVSRTSSGGVEPVSLTTSGSRLFVLNAGDNTVSGLLVSGGGKLVSMPHGTRALTSGADGSSTISATPDGNWVLVTEKVSNRVEALPIENNGGLGNPVVTASNGAVPFGFDITRSGLPIVTEADGADPNGAVSSYNVATNGTLSVITPSLSTGGVAACWLILTANDQFAYVANAGSNAIALFSVSNSGRVSLLNSTAASPGAGASPTDIDLTAGDGFLYALDSGSGNISGYSVAGNGALTHVGDIRAGAPASGLQGVTAW